MSTIDESGNHIGSGLDLRAGRRRARVPNFTVNRIDRDVFEGDQDVVYVVAEKSRSGESTAHRASSLIFGQGTEESSTSVDNILLEELIQDQTDKYDDDTYIARNSHRTKSPTPFEPDEEAIIDYVDDNYSKGTAVAMRKSGCEEIASETTMSDLMETLMDTDYDEDDTLIVRSNGE